VQFLHEKNDINNVNLIGNNFINLIYICHAFILIKEIFVLLIIELT